MKKHFNKLTPSEAERLSILSEECGEVIRAIGKIQRHGWKCQGYNNRENLEIEIGDLSSIIQLMVQNEDINEDHIFDNRNTHEKKIRGFTHHQRWDE